MGRPRNGRSALGYMEIIGQSRDRGRKWLKTESMIDTPEW
jgi:hypothetical protein